MVMWWQLCVCSLAILLLVPCSFSEKFSLAGSPHLMVRVVGQDVVLPCQLSPPARLSSMDILWRKIGSGYILVHEYSDEGSRDLPGESYQTRTELFRQEFSSGNVSLKLKRLQVVDDGKYQCLVRNPEWSQEATTELRVAAVAPVFIDVLGPRGQGIGLICRSTGWFPKPKLQWVGKNGQNLAMEIVTNMTQDRENLYSVVSHITVTEGEDNGDISCIVHNGLLETQRQSAIHLSGDIFPHVSPWLAAFWILFTLVLIAAGACAYLGYTAKQKASQKKHFKEIEKNTLEAGCQEMHQLIDAQRKICESEWQELSKEFDAQRKAFESVCQELCQLHERKELPETIDAKMKAFKSECDKLCETIDAKRKTFESESQENENKLLDSESQENENKLLDSESQENENKLLDSDKGPGLMDKLRFRKGGRKKHNEEELQGLRSQVGSVKMGRKSLKKLMEEVRKRKDIPVKEKESLMEKIRKLEEEKDELMTQIEMSEIIDNGKEIHNEEELQTLKSQVDELQIEVGKLQKERDELKVELKWRRARTYADDITLNPDTAQPNLSISEDKKKLINEAQPQKVPMTPERFDSTDCVLGSEGFSSGEHYWEVDVRSSNDWDLGVARKSIQRKGKLSLSPKEGFWALGWSGRDYWAKTDPCTQVIVQKKPEKIGVYLHYQEGQVTFFNATDMSVLFTFNDCSFSGEVHPFFKNSHKETSMRICSIREDE